MLRRSPSLRHWKIEFHFAGKYFTTASIADRFATGWGNAGFGGGRRRGGGGGGARGRACWRRTRGGGSGRRDRHRHLLAQQRGYPCRNLLSDRLGAGAAV